MKTVTPGAEESPLIQVKQLEVGHRGRCLLPAFDLEIGRAEFWAIIGRNGSGKTTWLRTLLGLQSPVAGEIIKRPGLQVSYLPQRGINDDIYPVTGRDVVAMGCLRGWSLFLTSQQHQVEVDRALELMGAQDIAGTAFRELSEGQRQRILFSRIAASQADVALLDEPTSALDLIAEREAFELLRLLQVEAKTTILIVSHYVRLAAEFADHAILLDRDTPDVVVGSPAEVLEHSSFKERYGTTSLGGLGAK